MFNSLRRKILGSPPLANDTDTINQVRAKNRQARLKQGKQDFYNVAGPAEYHLKIPTDPPSSTSPSPSPRPSISSFVEPRIPQPDGPLDFPVGTSPAEGSKPVPDVLLQGSKSPVRDVFLKKAQQYRSCLNTVAGEEYVGDFVKDAERIEQYSKTLIELVDQLSLGLDTSSNIYCTIARIREEVQRIQRCISSHSNLVAASRYKEPHITLRILEDRFNKQLSMFTAIYLSQQNQSPGGVGESANMDPAALSRQVEMITGKTLDHAVVLCGSVAYRTRSPLENGDLKTNYRVVRGKLNSGASVAIKTHSRTFENDSDGADDMRRIVRQVTLWTSFSSPYILGCYGIGMEKTSENDDDYDKFEFYIVSPFLKNGNAASFVSNRRRMGTHVRVLQLIRQIALGIRYLHHRDRPVTHAGVRGENVLIKDDETACLTGFCLSKEISLGSLTQFSGKSFQARWQAPELFEPARTLTIACDIWSWAMTALQLVSNQEPYYAMRTDWEIYDALRAMSTPKRSDYPYFDQYCQQPAADLVWALLERCWAVATQRPTIDEVITELERIEALQVA